MSSEESIFAAVLNTSVEQRAAYLDKACRGDSELRNRVELLLAAHDNPDSVFAGPAETMAGETWRSTILPPQIADFEIIRQIGQGGMGIVFEARQVSLNRNVALKVLSSGLGLTAKAVMRFRREAEAAAKLHHTNIVPIYATGEDAGIHFYAMELVAGPSVDKVIQYLRGDGKPSLPEPSLPEDSENEAPELDLPGWVTEKIAHQRPGADGSGSTGTSSSSLLAGGGYFDAVAKMVAEVADALDHAHDHGVIHRDIKPSNLLLAPDGHLSVNDFGLARVLEQPGMTMTGEFVGSPLYMSPEQIAAGRTPLDHRTDIYSLGATLYELLTLEPPYTGERRDEVLSQIMHKETTPPRRKNRRIPIDLETICLKAMEKDPDRRYQTAAVMAGDLRSFVNRHAISARRTGPIGKTLKYFRRNPAVAGMLGMLLIGVVIAVVAVAHQRGRERQRALQELDDQLLERLLAGDYETARDALRRGRKLAASPFWLALSDGQIELFRGDYEEAKLHFQQALKHKPKNLAARALLAVSYNWSGDEPTYLRMMRGLEAGPEADFEELFYLGYANIWGDSRMALRLLNQAEEKRPNHPLVWLFRGMASRLRGMATVDPHDAEFLIGEALLSVNSVKGMLKETPLVTSEYVLANLAAANLYERLGESDKAKSYRREALQFADRLRRFPENDDAQIALIYLLQQTENDEAILQLSTDWQLTDKVRPYTAELLAAELMRLKRYSDANYWLNRTGSRRRQMNHFLEYYIRIADPNRKDTRSQLQRTLRETMDRRVDGGETAYLGFEALLLVLLGDPGGIDYYAKDSLSHLYTETFRPHKKYFRRDPEIGSPTELIRACGTNVWARAHAHFDLAVTALARGEAHFAEAEGYFQACVDDDFFHFYVYWLSRAILAHRDNWAQWLED